MTRPDATRGVAPGAPRWLSLRRFLFAGVLAVAGLGSAAIASPPQDRGNTSDASAADVDGPYAFDAEGRGWTVKRIVKSGTEFKAAVDSVPASKPEIEVPLPGRSRPLIVRLRPPGDPPPPEVPAPESLFAVSDLEGNVDALIRLLRAANVVDDDLRWTYGRGHLVFVGDLFDRGLHVIECLWLFYELEARAQAAGGAVHFLLGNHEVMNLTGDLRYVRTKYRENAALLGDRLEDLYSRRTVLGRWLRTRNAILRIGDELFVHGGISPAVARAGVSVPKLDEALREALLADRWTKPGEGPLGLAAGHPDGLIWYRGYVKEPVLGEKEMDAILAAFRAKRVVVGHTIVPRIDFAIGGRVLALDVHHAGGNSQAAVRERGQWYRLHPDGKREKL